MEKGIRAWVPEHVRRLLRPGAAGEILLVTSAGVYLELDGEILLLCDAGWGILPIGIGVENFPHVVRRMRLRQEQRVRAEEDRLIFPEGSILLLPVPSLQWRTEERTVVPALVRRGAEELAALRKERGISMLVQPLVLGIRTEDERPADPCFTRAHTHLRGLIDAFRRADGEAISRCVENLLGLGAGLTPSADDVLLGMVYVFRALPGKCPPCGEIFRESVARLCPSRTNRISAAYLNAVLAGAPFSRMEEILRGMCGPEPLNIEKLIQIGSSSGSEMLLGMLIALRICGYDLSKKEELP